MKAQESRLEELRQHESSRGEVHQLLQQANKDMVSFQRKRITLEDQAIDYSTSHMLSEHSIV